MTRVLQLAPVPPTDATPLQVADAFAVRNDVAARVLTLSGDLDGGATRLLAAAAASLVDDRPGPVTVDLRDVTFVDAGGLGALVALSNTLRRRGQTLLVRHAAPRVRRIVVLGGLSTLLAED